MQTGSGSRASLRDSLSTMVVESGGFNAGAKIPIFRNLKNRQPARVKSPRGIVIRLQPAACFSLFFIATCSASCQAGPGFCEQPQAADLRDLQAPYAQQKAPDGALYCEGLLPRPIASPPPTVVSLKQEQSDVASFKSGGVATLNWCDDPKQDVHISLRSMVIPLFALDALHSHSFNWRTDLVSKWQPNWDKFAATATRAVILGGNTYTVFIPLRIGDGHSDNYSFVLRADDSIHFSKVLLQPLKSDESPKVLDVAVAHGPADKTSVVTVRFMGILPGIYRVTFQGGSIGAPRTTEPIYVLHKSCP